jgi:hypothetical protein
MKWLKDNWSGDSQIWELSNKYGQPIEFVADTAAGSGITWVNEGPVYTNTTNSWQVSSRALVSPVDFVVPEAAGMLYCKLISPARIMEWLLVDGLKKGMYWTPGYPSSESIKFLTK